MIWLIHSFMKYFGGRLLALGKQVTPSSSYPQGVGKILENTATAPHGTDLFMSS